MDNYNEDFDYGEFEAGLIADAVEFPGDEDDFYEESESEESGIGSGEEYSGSVELEYSDLEDNMDLSYFDDSFSALEEDMDESFFNDDSDYLSFRMDVDLTMELFPTD